LVFSRSPSASNTEANSLRLLPPPRKAPINAAFVPRALDYLRFRKGRIRSLWSKTLQSSRLRHFSADRNNLLQQLRFSDLKLCTFRSVECLTMQCCSNRSEAEIPCKQGNLQGISSFQACLAGEPAENPMSDNRLSPYSLRGQTGNFERGSREFAAPIRDNFPRKIAGRKHSNRSSKAAVYRRRQKNNATLAYYPKRELLPALTSCFLDHPFDGHAAEWCQFSTCPYANSSAACSWVRANQCIMVGDACHPARVRNIHPRPVQVAEPASRREPVPAASA
jgi:hypothetical protein